MARRRHRAARDSAAETTSTLDDVIPSIRSEAGTGLSFQSSSWFSTYRIHHRRARAVSRPPLLPARRRRAHPQPGRRAGHEHRPAGRVQPRLEARARRVRKADARAARLLRGRAHPGRPATVALDGPGAPRSSSPTASSRSCRPNAAVSEDPGSRVALREITAARLPHGFRDRHSVPRRPSLRNPCSGPAPSRASGRRSLPRGCGSNAPAERRRSRICSRNSTTRNSISS